MAATKCICGNIISCGCQRRKASDGTMRCTKCIAAYEAQLKKLRK